MLQEEVVQGGINTHNRSRAMAAADHLGVSRLHE
jgi:hypothetical protein